MMFRVQPFSHCVHSVEAVKLLSMFVQHMQYFAYTICQGKLVLCHSKLLHIVESVDSTCRDSTDTQCMIMQQKQ